MVQRGTRAGIPPMHDGPLGLGRNPYRVLPDGSVEISITQGKVTWVGAEDFHKASPLRLYARSRTHKGVVSWYVQANVQRADGTRQSVALHKILRPEWPVVDHADRNGLNNRGINLRPANYSENNANKGVRPDNKSGYVGVHHDPAHCPSRPWVAQVQKDSRKQVTRHATLEGAVHWRDRVARESFGPFAVTNESLGILPPLDVLPESMAAD